MEPFTQTFVGTNGSSTNVSKSTPSSDERTKVVLIYTLIPLVTVLCVIGAILMIMWALRRSRMEKLRHHLMPMYSIDPSDSGQEWEVDLLSQEIRLGADSGSPHSSPTLKLKTMHSEL